MRILLHVLAAAAAAGLATGAVLGATSATTEPTAADKALVTDGHVYHDVGLLTNHVTNFGLIGSRPGVPSSFSQAPSARWRGLDHLWTAGVWIGGVVLGERLVSTGQFASEIMASDAPADTIYATAHGAPGGARFPWPGADDDGDGAEDEDPLDGRDNDADGLIDEDFAAIGAQHFECVMADDMPAAVEAYPDHVPMGLDVVQRSFQWDDPAAAEFIGYEYRATNGGVVAIENVHCGMFADFDLGFAEDDLAGSFSGPVNLPDGSPVPVSVAWMRDAGGETPGWVGFVLCGVETDAAGGLVGGDPLELFSFDRFSGQAPFEQGGDPTNDSERYELLSTAGRDADVPAGQESDYRVLFSTPQVPRLEPGETVILRCALVIGDGREAMLANAAQAVVTALGKRYDRDGDPGNGLEFHVPWLRPDEEPVPTVVGSLLAELASRAVTLDFDVRHLERGAVTVARRAAAGVPGRRWELDRPRGRVTDDDPVGWPRTYDLKLAAGSGELLLDTVELPGPAAAAALRASPNPFNPRLTITTGLPQAGWARLTVHDTRGRLVRVLFDEWRPAGESPTLWAGRDDAGRAVASGVYLVRFGSEAGLREERVTLVR